MDAAAFDAHVVEIQVYGYTIVHNVLDAGQCGQLRETLLECARRFGEGHNHRTPTAADGVGAWHIANLPTMARCFHPLVDHPKVLPLIEHFMGRDVILGSLSSRIVRPGDPVQGLHGDIGQDMVDACPDRSRPNMMNTVWMLQDTGPFNGGTRVVPGSHMSGISAPEIPLVPHDWQPPLVVQPSAPAGQPTAASCRRYCTASVCPGHCSRLQRSSLPDPLNAPSVCSYREGGVSGIAGSVLIYNGHCWHAGGANTSDNAYRCSMFGHYRKSLEAFPAFGGRIFQCDPVCHHSPPTPTSTSTRLLPVLAYQNLLGDAYFE
jgi:ectoine hydroxylase-related dioxygenase (phytanoyl-CoA dioxygenase family)